MQSCARPAPLVIIFIGALADYSFQVVAGPTSRQSLAQLMVSMKDQGDRNAAAVVGTAAIGRKFEMPPRTPASSSI